MLLRHRFDLARSRFTGPVAALLFAGLTCACEHAAKPIGSGVQSGAATTAGSAPAPPAQSASSALSPSSAPVASANAPPSSSPDAVDPLQGAPLLLDEGGKPLGQTEDKPSIDSAAFKARIALLWRAIVADDPSIAEPAFFPVVAYEQVKDIKNPAGDWKRRLFKNFGRDVRGYHKKLGAEAAGLRLVGIEVDDPRVKWMGRGKEGNKLGYFRVMRSKLRYADPSGKEHTFEVTSLISWRGEWFVVHLHGFK